MTQRQRYEGPITWTVRRPDSYVLDSIVGAMAARAVSVYLGAVRQGLIDRVASETTREPDDRSPVSSRNPDVSTSGGMP